MNPSPSKLGQTKSAINIDILPTPSKNEPVEILAAGLMNSTEKKAIGEIIIKAAQTYPKQIDEQLKVIKFHANVLLGKRVQILIMHKAALEGHCLYAASGKYFVGVYNMYQYIIWKVRLIEDQIDMPIE